MDSSKSMYHLQSWRLRHFYWTYCNGKTSGSTFYILSHNLSKSILCSHSSLDPVLILPLQISQYPDTIKPLQRVTFWTEHPQNGVFSLNIAFHIKYNIQLDVQYFVVKKAFSYTEKHKYNRVSILSNSAPFNSDIHVSPSFRVCLTPLHRCQSCHTCSGTYFRWAK